MALAFTAPSPIAEVSDVDASSYTTTGTAGANNKLYLITVENSHATAPALPTLTHSGGLTCVEIANSVASNRRVTLFRALKTTGVSAGTFTADAAGATPASWAGGVGGAIVQSDTSAGSGTTATGNLAAFADAVNNAAFMATMNNLNSPITEEAGYTELADLGHANPTRRVETEYKLGEDTSVTSTFSSAAWHCIAVEVKKAAGGQIIALGQVTETDLAQAISWAPKRRLLGQVTETDLAQALTGRKTLVLGQATETDLAQAITRLVAGQTIPLGQVSETDLAQAFGVRKTKALGQVTESDLAQSLTSRKTKALGQVTETDLAQALTRVKTRALGQVTETDLAQALAWAPKHRLLGQVTETDLAQAFSVVGGAVFDPTPVICGTETLTAITCDTAALSAVMPDSLTLTPSC